MIAVSVLESAKRAWMKGQDPIDALCDAAAGKPELCVAAVSHIKAATGAETLAGFFLADPSEEEIYLMFLRSIELAQQDSSPH